MLPGSTERREAPLRLGSASNAWSALSSTLGRMMFCSTVSRISPPEYLSARSAICRASATERRPTGTCTPTRDLPACGCECTPRRERRSKGAVALGCAFSTLVDISLMTRLRNFSLTRGWPLTSLTSPYSSMSHMSRPFCRSLRPPWSRKMRRMAAVKSVVASTVAGIQTSRSTLSATRLIDM